MNSSDPSAARKSEQYRTLSLVPVLAVLAIGVALARYSYVKRTAAHHLFQVGQRAIQEDDADLMVSAAEGLRGHPEYQAHVHLLLGAALLRSGQPIEAIIEFGYAKDHPELRALSHTLSGEALYKTHQYQDAIKILSYAVEFDPGQTDAHRWLAATYFDIGAMNHAIDHLRYVSQQAADDPRPHRLMGLIYRDFEEYEKAIRAYRKTLECDPEQPDWQQVRYELAECLIKQKSFEEARDVLERCPESAENLWLRAETELGLGRPESARASATRALEQNPEHLEALYLKANLELQANDIEAAVKTGNRVVSLYPNEWRPRYTLAMAYRRQGKTEQAAEHLKRMEQLSLLREEFTKLHAKAITEPEDVQVRFELGQTAEELGRLDLAVNWYEMTLAMEPQHAEARSALQEIMNRSGPAAVGHANQ